MRKRIALAAFSDGGGAADGCALRFLDELSAFYEKIIIIASGKIDEESLDQLSRRGELIRNEKRLFAAEACKLVFNTRYDEIINYDECTLTNFDFFKIRPLDEMFNKMENVDCGFWGATEHYGAENHYEDGEGYIKIDPHVQTYFITFRNSVLISREFKSFWAELPEIRNKYHENLNFSHKITKILNDAGFKRHVYVKTGDLSELTANPFLYMPLETYERGCPFLNKNVFTGDFITKLKYSDASAGRCAAIIIENSGEAEICKNVLRNYTNSTLHKNAGHVYVLPSGSVNPGDEALTPKIAAILHCYYPDQIETCLKYLKNMPERADLYVTVSSKETENAVALAADNLKIKIKQIITVKNVGRSESALLIGCARIVNDYGLICFIHDKKSSHITPGLVGRGFYLRCLDNLLASREYALNIINLFMQNERLGIITPPPPNHGSFYHVLGTEWAGNFEITSGLCEKLNINVPLDRGSEPISAFGGMFWFRPGALKKFFEYDWVYGDFPVEPLPPDCDGTILHAIERAYGLAAQNEGYYTGWVMSDLNAGQEINNLTQMLRSLNESLFKHIKTQDFYTLKETLDSPEFNAVFANFNKKNTPLFRRVIRKILPEALRKRLKIIGLHPKGR